MTGKSNTDDDVSDPGLPALVKRLNRLWRLDKYNRKADCDILDDPRTSLTTLAIPLEKAYEIWGYGRVVGAEPSNAAGLPTARLRGTAWSDHDLSSLLQDFEAAPGKTVKAKREAVAIARKVSPDTIKKYVNIAKGRAKEKAEAERAAKLFPSAQADKR